MTYNPEQHENDSMQYPEIIALAQFLDCDYNDIERSKYGNNRFDIDGKEYLVLSDQEAQDLAEEYIKESLWAFNAEFIIEHSALPYEALDMIKNFQSEKCESANDTIEALITDMDEFISDAIAADGRGHFLNTYDGEENTQSVNGETYFIYRTN